MKKNILIPLILVSLLSCGRNNGSNQSEFPVLQRLNEDYVPLGLSEKNFEAGGETYSPMDLQSQELELTFDPVSQTVNGHSKISFKLKNGGRPYFELQASLSSAELNGKAVSVSTISDPDGQNQSYRALNQSLSAGEVHQVEFNYQLPTGRVTFAGGGGRFLTDMTDLNGKFFEYWGPVGFEGDTFSMYLKLKVENSTSTHALISNGSSSSTGAQSWDIVFPEYFGKSSFYVHLTNVTGLTVKRFDYQGLEKKIPVEVYGASSSLVNSAASQLPKLFAEFEKDYGAYAHNKFVAYMTDRSGGMEYVGATITSLASLDHELLHSWFGRSVIPADGRSGWLDEAMASWRDYGYQKASTLLQRTPTNLANYSAYRKSTPSNSYVDGRALMAELDHEFSSFGGLKTIMKAFFQRYKNKIMTNEEFWHFLELQTNLDLEPFNQRYAMSEAEEEQSSQNFSRHPKPLSKEDVLKLR